jgi:hypothetical protein
MILDVVRIFYELLLVDMPKFKWKIFASSIITSDWKWCYGFGWENDELSLNIQ